MNTIANQPTRILFCFRCNADMPHVLNKSQTAYVCSCGTQVRYEINYAKEACAIPTRESHDAQDRFARWCNGEDFESVYGEMTQADASALLRDIWGHKEEVMR